MILENHVSDPEQDRETRSSTPAHRVGMAAFGLAEAVREIDRLSKDDETAALLENDMRSLIVDYTRLGFLLSALNRKAA